MENKILKTLALTGAMMGLVSCGDQGKGVPDEDRTPLTLIEKEIVPTDIPCGTLYFDADGNKETYEYIGEIYKLDETQKLADFKHRKIGTQAPANMWKKKVDGLRKVEVRE